MSDDGWNIAPPPFDAAAALQTLRRFLREQQGLAERGQGWLLGGDEVLQLAIDGAIVRARLAKRPARSPDWEVFTLKSAPDVRRLQDEVKRRLLRWRGDA